jgi:hypothetical protein
MEKTRFLDLRQEDEETVTILKLNDCFVNHERPQDGTRSFIYLEITKEEQEGDKLITRAHMNLTYDDAQMLIAYLNAALNKQ